MMFPALNAPHTGFTSASRPQGRAHDCCFGLTLSHKTCRWSSSLCRGHKQPTTGASEATRCLCLVRHSGGEPVDFLPVFPQSDPRAPEGPALHPCPLIPPCEHLTTARLCATASTRRTCGEPLGSKERQVERGGQTRVQNLPS